MRALWELTRQRSKDLVPEGALRSSPDLWEVLAGALGAVNQTLPDALEDFAVARFFAGEPSRRRASAYRVLRALPDGAAVSLAATLAFGDLPRHVRLDDEGLAPLGSAYVRVVTTGASAGTELRVWLRGEIDPQWSLVAVRLAADGGELGRVTAAQRRVPQSYLPVLLTADTAQVVLVVTYLLPHTPDADRVPLPHRGFELILDRGPQ
jgi:hypothetical protein